MWLKVSRSSFQSRQSSFDVIVAALGALYSRASSPKASPGWYYFRKVGSVLPGKIFEQDRVPEPIT